MFTVQVKNVKVSISFANTLSLRRSVENLRIKTGTGYKNGTFFVFRDHFVFTIFNNGHVNCTKIPSVKDIDRAVNHIELILNEKSEKVTIDNIVASGQISRFIAPKEFALFLQEKGEKVHFNPQRFPGACLKLSTGCMLFFQSGKLVFAGLKNLLFLDREVEKITQYYNEYIGLSSLRP